MAARSSKSVSRSSSSRGSDRSSANNSRWVHRNRWQTVSVVLVVAAAVGIFGAYRLGQSNAYSAVPVYENFWTGGPVMTRPNIKAGVVGFMKAGNHLVSSQVNCNGYPGGVAVSGSIANGWWAYLPKILNKGGWVNEIAASGGSNYHSSWPNQIVHLYAPGWC
ncbi:MAG TPA: hypothetical protein VLG47_08030 [Candidatus Saccharimonadales bacterium]|nr:hypothetical protein [Candidatus Saccharimonadales bacterium]